MEMRLDGDLSQDLGVFCRIRDLEKRPTPLTSVMDFNFPPHRQPHRQD